MSPEITPEERAIGEICEHELARLRKDWWCLLLLGILLVVGGMAAIVYPCYTSVGVVVFFGAVLMVSGIATIISAFWAGRWGGFFVQILVGLLYAVAGYVITDAPLESTALMTLMLAGFFVVAGGFRIVTALVDKYPQWGWALLNGIVTLLVGLVIFRSFRLFPDEPDKIFWIIGLLVGVELLFNGWTWIMLSIAVKRLPAPDEDVS
jgi:uncharacterized membrane protein HdeD (DUF308 family)